MKKQILFPGIVSVGLIITFMLLRNRGIVNCPVSYLNPWQYFFYCTGFDICIYSAILISSFGLVFLIQESSEKRLN